MAEGTHLAGERRSGVRGKKGVVVGLYTAPPAGSTVICLDELGPVAAKSYPGPSWSDDAHRPHFPPSYARHGYRWAFGALAHRTGAVCVQTAATRDTAAWLHFLDGLGSISHQARRISSSTPSRSTGGIDTMLWNWGHPRFHFIPLPKRAAWLNLIEGFWKILRQRALAGRVCSTTDEVDQALQPAWPTGIGAQRRFSGTVPPNPRACSNDDMSIAFEERRT